MKIFVGNIATDVSDLELEELFKAHGDVREVKIIRDMFSQASKGFGFVEMKDKIAGETAIKEINTLEIKGKKLVVNEARPDNDNRRGGGRKSNNKGSQKGGSSRRR